MIKELLNDTKGGNILQLLSGGLGAIVTGILQKGIKYGDMPIIDKIVSYGNEKTSKRYIS